MRAFLASMFVSLGLATASAAAPIDVGFSFSNGIDTVSGFLTFDDFGDTRANSVVLTSNNFGENSATFFIDPIFNFFDWSANTIVRYDFAATTTISNAIPTSMVISLYSPDFFIFSQLDCGSAVFGCNGREQISIAQPGLIDFTYPTTVPVPLPASLPLLLAGLGGLAVVRKRRSRAAQA